MIKQVGKSLLLSAFALTSFASIAAGPGKSMYVVEWTECSIPGDPENAMRFLEKSVLPSMDRMNKMLEEGKVLAGGIRAGSRDSILIIQASSADELDKAIRDIPLWPYCTWKATPLQTFAGRAAMERPMLDKLKKTGK